MGLFLLTFIRPIVFFLGLIFALVGFFYSWRSLRLKSIPFMDLISHVIFLGVLQFLITYLAFRPLDLFVIPFLMIIIPFSLMNEVLGELRDLEVDKKGNIDNTIQRFENFDLTKLLITSVVIVMTGFSIIIFTIPPRYKIVNLLISLFICTGAIFKMNAWASSITQAREGKLSPFSSRLRKETTYLAHKLVENFLNAVAE